MKLPFKMTWLTLFGSWAVTEPQQSKVTLHKRLKAPGLIFASLLPLLPWQYFTKPDRNVSTLVCLQLKCLDSHRHFSLSARCQNCCGTPSTTTHASSHQANTDKQTDSFAIQLTNMHTPAHTHTHTLSQQWEVVLKLWQTVQPAEAIHGELFCSVVWCCFSN